jgi:hypothetical protein
MCSHTLPLIGTYCPAVLFFLLAPPSSHAGEINTLQGNLNWVASREHELTHPAWHGRESALLPLCNAANSDSANLDNVAELMVRANGFLGPGSARGFICLKTLRMHVRGSRIGSRSSAMRAHTLPSMLAVTEPGATGCWLAV